VTYALARDARVGTWHAELRLDPKAPAIGMHRIPRRGFRAAAAQGRAVGERQPVKPGEPYPVAVAARYYYGAPESASPSRRRPR